MPRTGDTYALPTGGPVAGTEAVATNVTALTNDLAAEQNLVRPISAGGTGGSTASAARTALGVAIGSDVQAYDADLAALAAAGFATLSLFAACGGTANALTLTSGASLASLTEGQEFRFKLTNTNTGASTVAIDGLTAIDIVTADGSATPAGYLTSGEYVIGRITSGGDLRVRWETARKGSGANGTYIRYDNGEQTCRHTMNAGGTWTFPAAFSAVPIVTHMAPTISGASRIATYDPAAYSATAVDIDGWNTSDGTATPSTLLFASGTWY